MQVIQCDCCGISMRDVHDCEGANYFEIHATSYTPLPASVFTKHFCPSCFNKVFTNLRIITHQGVSL